MQTVRRGIATLAGLTVVAVMMVGSHTVPVTTTPTLAPVNAPAGCWNDDGPGCSCFTDTGDWLPSGATINAIATSTLGTIASCLPSSKPTEGGKPYYQMCLGANSAVTAHNMAWTIDLFGQCDRQAWCSETISYWHREAGIPYSGGLRNTSWHLAWQCPNTNALHTFYRVEEEIAGGRGRWIDWWELDYDDFRPGVNAPVPGAYVKIQKCEIGADGQPDWKDCNGTCHSMMVDTMTVYRTSSGDIQRVAVEFIEGNAGADHEVRNTRDVDDLLSVTPLGDDDFAGSKRIVGFGIDLSPDGTPIYGRSISYVTVPASPDPDSTLPGTWRVTAQAPLVRELADYARRLQLEGGIETWCSHPRIQGTSRLPDGHLVRWALPADLPGVVTVAIDLKQEHPLKIWGIYLDWSTQGVPEWIRVWWAGADGAKKPATVPRLRVTGAGRVLEWHPDMPVPVLFDSSGADVQYIMIELPTGEALTLEELSFVYKWPGGEDAAENRIEKTIPAI